MDPEEQDAPFDTVDFTLAQRRATLGNAFASIEDEPDKAARAQELSDRTGVPPALVYGDLDNFEKQHKAGLAASILNNSAALRKYLDDEPLAAKVSNDDYGQLDAVSKSMEDFVDAPGVGLVPTKVHGEEYAANIGHLLKETIKSLQEGPTQYKQIEADTMAYLLEQGMSPEDAKIKAAMAGASAYRGEALTNILFAVPTVLASPVIAAFQTNISKPLEQATGFPAQATDMLTMSVLAAVGFVGARPVARMGEPKPSGPPVSSTAEIIQFLMDVDKYAKGPVPAQVLIPYIRDGKTPPPGVHPLTDAAHVEQAKVDGENLSTALKEASTSATRERSPELFTSFLKGITDGEIGISADAVRKLYGDKVPVPGDGPLGFVPDLAAQLERAEATGGDIRVSTAEWLGKVEPEVAKELQDHIRARPEGVTVEEGKELAPPEGTPGAPVDTVRQAAGLQGQVAERKLQLERIDQSERDGDTTHSFMLNKDGKSTGTLYVTEEKGGKRLYIDDIEGLEGPNSFGSRAMRDVLEQLKDEFPNAETLTGQRVSGARGKNASWETMGNASIDLTKIKPRAKFPEPEAPGLLQQVKEAIVGKSPEQLKLDLERVEEKAIFDKAAAVGRTVAQYKRMMKLIDQQHAEDIAAAEKRAEKEVKRRLTPEWKANRATMREQVAEEMRNIPEVELDEMLRKGEVKLLVDYVTPEQGKVLPKDWIMATGMHPEDLAALFGGKSAPELVAKLTELVGTRKTANMAPKAYFDRMVDIQTDRSMEAAYGNLERNIIDEAKDQVLSETQVQLLHEDTLARAEAAGIQFSFTKEDTLVMSKARVDGTLAKQVSSDKYLAESGRAGRAIEEALTKGDAMETFRQQQRQYFAILDAKQAMRLEKAMEKVDRLAAKYKNAKVNGVDPAARNYVHALLKQAGYPIKLTAEEIAASGAFEGHGTLAEYAVHLGDFGIDNVIPESVLEGSVKPLTEQTTAEFYDFKDAVEALDHIGREQMRITVAGEKQDFADWKARALESLRERPIRDAAETERGGKWLYRIDAPWTRPEEMFKDFDMRKDLGPFFEAVVIPYELSKAKSYEMLEKLSKDLKGPGFKAKWQKSLDDPIPNDFIFDVWNETMFDLNRWNMIKMMQNWGNESNAMKLSEGILRAGREVGDKVSKDEIKLVHDRVAKMFDEHATAEDWSYVQKMWDMFEGWKEPMETLHRNMTGQAPKWVKGREVVTPHGTFQGGYFPLIPDKLRRIGAGIKEKGQPDTGPLGPDYFRATTNQKHLKTRTGATYFVDITSGPEQLVGRMQQVIHDLAYRDFVVNAGKVLYDTEVQNAIQKHYGVEYQEQMIPWLKRVANQSNAPERELQGWNDVLRRFRGNLVAAALPLNYAVMLSPSVGLLNVKQMVQFNANRSANKAMVMANSKEIPHMLYTLDRDVTEALKTSAGRNDWTSYQLMVTEKMFKPLIWMEQQFRMQTFYTEFMSQKGQGRTDFEASALADSKVREQHSVGAIGDLPALMASKNEFVKLSTLFMGYFTSQRNWMRQAPHYAREREWANFAKVLWGSIGVAFAFNAALFTSQKKDEGMLSYLARAAASVPLAGIPLIRNVWGYYSEGYRSTDPITSFALAVGKLGKDGWDWLQHKPVKKPIRDTMTVLGGGLGVPGSVQIGRTGQGMYDAATGAQRPRNIVEWMRLVLKGEAQQRK